MKTDEISLFRKRFGRDPSYVARAPGRIEFLGNHTDYNGGEVLGGAVDSALTVSVGARPDGKIRLASGQEEGVFEASSAEGAMRAAKGWVRYPMGVLSVLRSLGLPDPGGFDFLVQSDIPSGAGLSSSAALELASALAFENLGGKEFSRIERVRACRRAENEFVGVPCGILDQGVSGFGAVGRLVHIDCADESFSTVPGLDDTVFWVFESGHKHSLVDSFYAERHRECREALEAVREIRPDLDWLAHASLEDLEAARGKMSDTVYRRAEHVVREQGRVRECVGLLEKRELSAVGGLLFASHDSSSRLFENSIEELDTLVGILGGMDGVYGARLTGGGFGGAVMALCRDPFDEASAGAVRKAFREKCGVDPIARRFAIADGASGRLVE